MLTAVAVSAVQTFLNIHDVEGLALTVTGAQVAWQNLLSFGPIMAAIAAVALVPALTGVQCLTRE